MRILYLCNKEYYLYKMSRVRFHSMQAIGKISEVIWWGIGWDNYNNEKTVQENINNLDKKPDIIVSYKPLEMKNFKEVSIPKCLRYNEMFDKEWTIKEITESGANLVICHHKNEMPFYQEYFGNKVKFYHIPHSAETTIFKDYNLPKTTDILLVGMIHEKYPLRQKIQKLLSKDKKLKKYNSNIFQHPGYNRGDANSDVYAIEFAKAINSSKITVTCSMVYRNRLAKYVEIPMCASVLAADLPAQDQEDFKQFIIEINTKMKNKQIVEKLIYYLENDEERQKLIHKGLEWCKNYTQEKYAEKFIETVNTFLSDNLS